MQEVGTQVTLPLGRAFRISVQGIRIRIGRSLVTVSGVVLGIAFMMSNLTSQLIQKAVARERETKQTVNLMESFVRSEVGSVEGRRLAVAVFGAVTPAETTLLARLMEAKPAAVAITGMTLPGAAGAEPIRLGEGADLLLVLGDATSTGVALTELTQGMARKVVLDSVSERTFAGAADPSVRRELFFGQQAEDRAAELRLEARQAQFRTIWIVVISLLVTVIGVSNALLMSVTERFREIGTMKCLGALSAFIRTLFLIESSLIGFIGSVLGVVLGALLTLVTYGFIYEFGVVFGSLSYSWLLIASLAALAAGTAMSVIAAIYPAHFAARMVPAAALRSTV